jgi:hypothetical protein
MRNGSLHRTLLEYAEAAAGVLGAEAVRAEVPFEVVAQGAGRSPLYCYRPLTGEFIRARVTLLGRLPAYGPAARALERHGGLDAYLRAHGEKRIPAGPRDRADAALRVLLARVFEDTSEFELTAERFERAYAVLEGMVQRERSLTTVAAPVLGLRIRSRHVRLGEGLALVRAGALEDGPPAAPGSAPPDPEEPAVLAVLDVEGPAEDPPSPDSARTRLRRLLTALRLFDAGRIALGPAAWARMDDGPWEPLALGGGAGAAGRLGIEPAEEDELRAFCSLVSRRTPSAGEVAWALARFEMACERAAPSEALTDVLLALRALLEPEGPSSGHLARRVSAICGVPGERPAMAERVAHAVSLERALVAGVAPAEADAEALVEELAGHLRALLRDALCGHLPPDLCGLADGLEPPAIGASAAPAPAVLA